MMIVYYMIFDFLKVVGGGGGWCVKPILVFSFGPNQTFILEYRLGPIGAFFIRSIFCILGKFQLALT